MNRNDPFYISMFEQLPDIESRPNIGGRISSPSSYDSHVVTGYVHNLSSGGGFLIGTNLHTYKMSVNFMARNNLAQCDYVELRVGFDHTTNAFIAQDLIQRLTEPDKRFDKMKPTKPAKEVNICSKYTTTLGDRTLIVTDKTYPRYEHTLTATKLLDECSAMGDLKKISLIAEENDFVTNTLQENNIDEIFTIKPNMPHNKQIVTCLLAIFTAKRLAASGSNVVLFVDNLSKLIRIYNNCLSASSGTATTRASLVTPGYTVGAVSDLKQYFLSARALDDGGSLTVTAYINKPDPSNEWSQNLYDEFSDMANTIITI